MRKKVCSGNKLDRVQEMCLQSLWIRFRYVSFTILMVNLLMMVLMRKKVCSGNRDVFAELMD